MPTSLTIHETRFWNDVQQRTSAVEGLGDIERAAALEGLFDQVRAAGGQVVEITRPDARARLGPGAPVLLDDAEFSVSLADIGREFLYDVAAALAEYAVTGKFDPLETGTSLALDFARHVFEGMRPLNQEERAVVLGVLAAKRAYELATPDAVARMSGLNSSHVVEILARLRDASPAVLSERDGSWEVRW